MEHGEYDLALTLLPMDWRLFSYEQVMEEELILAVPAAFPALPARAVADRKYPAVEADVLQDKQLVMLTDAQFMQQQLEAFTAAHGLSVRPAAVVKSLEAQIEMVKAGVGMALTTSGIERFCERNEVRFYSFTNDLPKRQIVVAWRKDRPLSRAAEELKAMIRSMKW